MLEGTDSLHSAKQETRLNWYRRSAGELLLWEKRRHRGRERRGGVGVRVPVRSQTPPTQRQQQQIDASRAAN